MGKLEKDTIEGTISMGAVRDLPPEEQALLYRDGYREARGKVKSLTGGLLQADALAGRNAAIADQLQDKIDQMGNRQKDESKALDESIVAMRKQIDPDTNKLTSFGKVAQQLNDQGFRNRDSEKWTDRSVRERYKRATQKLAS